MEEKYFKKHKHLIDNENLTENDLRKIIKSFIDKHEKDKKGKKIQAGKLFEEIVNFKYKLISTDEYNKTIPKNKKNTN